MAALPPVFPLLGAASFCAFSTRYALAPLVSVFIAAEYGYTAAQKTALLGAFFPGYVLSMIPGGVLAQACGGKIVFSVILLGHSMFGALIPSAAQRGPATLWACLCAVGLCQGPLFGAQKKVQAAWLPSDGPARARALMVVNLGSKLAGPATNIAVPLLAASRFGWRSVTAIYAAATGIFAILWQLLVAETPPGGALSAGATKAPAATAIEWGVFRVPAVYGPLLMHVAENTSMYAIMQMSPLIYTEVFGVAPAALGKYLALPPALNALGAPVIAEVERHLHRNCGDIRRGIPMLTIQRAATGFGAALETVCQVFFATTQLVPALRSPTLATLACSGVTLGHLIHWSGFYQNYHDVGGPDTAILFSVANTVANLSGVVIPVVANAFRKRSGSYAPLFLLCAAMEAAGGVVFCRLSSTDVAREMLLTRRQAGGE